MKKLTYLILFLCFSIFGYGQSYFPFPTIPAKWYRMFCYVPSNTISCSQYIQEGDTALNERWYRKVYLSYYNSNSSPIFLGGIREDNFKRIYFAPVSPVPTGLYFIQFPAGEPEVLLYTFDNLSIGMHLPINTGYTDITVYDIDSVLLGDSYRKRYLIHNPKLCGFDYWIEGIGSTKDLFSSYAREFEWLFYTLCFEDTVIYHVSPYNYFTECYYPSNVGYIEKENSFLNLFLVPAKNQLTVEYQLPSNMSHLVIQLTDAYGHILRSQISYTSKDCIQFDIQGLHRGSYLCNVYCENKLLISKKFVLL